MDGDTFKEKDVKGMDYAHKMKEVIKIRQAQGFVYNKADKDFTFQGKKYPQDAEQYMTDAFNNWFNDVDEKNSFCYSLGQFAYDHGYGWDEDEGKWYMINHKLGIREYIDDYDQASNMARPSNATTKKMFGRMPL